MKEKNRIRLSYAAVCLILGFILFRQSLKSIGTLSGFGVAGGILLFGIGVYFLYKMRKKK